MNGWMDRLLARSVCLFSFGCLPATLLAGTLTLNLANVSWGSVYINEVGAVSVFETWRIIEFGFAFAYVGVGVCVFLILISYFPFMFLRQSKITTSFVLSKDISPSSSKHAHGIPLVEFILFTAMLHTATSQPQHQSSSTHPPIQDDPSSVKHLRQSVTQSVTQDLTKIK